MNPTETTIEVEIGGQKHTLYFNLNAFSKFEEVSSLDENGKRLKFPKFLFRLLDAWSKVLKRGEGAGKPANPSTQPANTEPVQPAIDSAQSQALLDAISEIGAADIHALLYGALHVYDRDDRPSWPLSPGQLGRILGPMELIRLLPQIMTGMQANLPRASDTPKGGEVADRPMTERPTPARPVVAMPSIPNGGGLISGALEDDPLAFLTLKSEG